MGDRLRGVIIALAFLPGAMTTAAMAAQQAGCSYGTEDPKFIKRSYNLGMSAKF